jgi:hypothetical protein
MGEVVDVESSLVPDQEIELFFGVELDADEAVVGIMDGWGKTKQVIVDWDGGCKGKW